ncbi:uncharacterized protein LOC107040647 [Diachasma alloeum]|uniref:uncharacterized protein LOC107040647 n=1 Tax=Diachasma alloeum TaxID=454923 RepID=UPI0007381FD3|nr:uncharacterized protein LOC107040647 [Diachasma alloeum]
MPVFPGVLLSPLLLLMIVDGSWAFNARQTECAFPVRWEGTWFQSGVRQPILISKNTLSNKGKCLRNEGDKFLVVDEKSCYRCVVIHEKHANVLQYKETFCHPRNSLALLCSYITGDALLYSMFREEATAVPCPFRGPMTFMYNRGHGTCSNPLSNVDTCTDDSRLLFRYQACPDVPASESAVEELECLATWKEGSSRYLVGRLHHGHASSNEERYRCFVYERAGQSVGGMGRAVLGMATIDHEVGMPPSGPLPEGTPEVYRVAQSGDATCNGLFSPMEGSRTMTLTKASSPGKCRFPGWLTGHNNNGLTWHTLDLTRSYTFHPRNASLHVTRSNATRYDMAFLDFQDIIDGQEEQEIKILCNSIKQMNPTQTTTMIVAHFTVGCRSGFMCMTFYRRDGHVVEVQTGRQVSRVEDACSAPHSQSHSIPYLTLVTSSPEPRQCPYLGKFTVTGVNRNPRNIRENRRQSSDKSDEMRVRHSDDRRGHKFDFDVEKKKANNEYLIHERPGRRVRSDRMSRAHDPKVVRRTRRKSRSEVLDGVKRTPRSTKIEDFHIDAEELGKLGEFSDLEDVSSMVQVQDEYFGDYEMEKPEKRSNYLTYEDLLTFRRDVENDKYADEFSEKREKREEEDSRCTSEVTTLNIGCSTADRMEFQSDCVDENNAITAYSCHGRWFDAEGTQFVIATPLARRTLWSNSNNEPQAFRNSRRLCFMYRESGGVVSLTASTIACQREIPPPPPMLAFNATSIGQCMEDNGSRSIQPSHFLVIIFISLLIQVLR